MTDKKLAKIEKELGKEFMAELEAQDVSGLHARIVNAESAMKVASDELEANENYQRLKEDLKLLSQGLREVNKRQKAIIEYVLSLLEGKGQ